MDSNRTDATATRPTPSARCRALTTGPGTPQRPPCRREAWLSELVDAASNRDPVATQRVLESIRPLVVRYCRARMGRLSESYTSADDVVQEVCLSVASALPTYRNVGQPFLAFVYGIAQHKVADARRAVARDRSLPVPEVPDRPATTAGPEQRLLRQELSDSLRELLTVLTDRQREIVALRVVAGLSAEETADLVGSTPGAVRVAQHRALTALRDQIGNVQEFRACNGFPPTSPRGRTT
ncbi:RNA polymerase sigma factor ShbA [Kutzneria sp. CA-103260]|uniref:RNA polymerase sigma factor ShbA n=1 Tax=Kutzneria sp. CA-103260 TaxID=2802641 RepID=UPI001BADCB23|nr:RNA polymerase sigma factor ShbA [Kutzneria sp. CA-103260]QUQ64117.1 Sigma-70 region 2 [Kutzneria sp. CA-103260]